MTAAEELRAAAEKLRGLAAAATQGTWHVVPYQGNITGHEAGIGTTPDEDDIVGTGYEGGGIEWEKDARYVVAMQPGIGTALADWLHTAAANADALTWPNQFIESALAVARQILGSQP